MTRSSSIAVLVLVGALVQACRRGQQPAGAVHGRPAAAAPQLAGRPAAARGPLAREGRRPDPRWARPPRPGRQLGAPVGLRCVPDGDLSEWPPAAQSAAASGRAGPGRWLGDAEPLGVASGAKAAGVAPLRLRAAIASYTRGLCLALVVQDAQHVPAAVAAQLGKSDHVEIKLWPDPVAPNADPLVAAALGIHMRVGTRRQLVQVRRPAESWREQAITANGIDVAGGYQIEVRVPLPALTPLRSARVQSLRYEIIVHDADERGAVRPALRLRGELALAVPMELPESVPARPALRVCRAADPRALWAYRNGWRCAMPYRGEPALAAGGAEPDDVRLGFARAPAPPRLQWLRERLLFINIEGAGRGAVALLDARDRILSWLPLGVVGAEDPGNSRTRNSDAEPVQLPDGTWAVSVIHASPAAGAAPGGRCSVGHDIYVSIIAVRARPPQASPGAASRQRESPRLVEVFHAQLEDCVRSRSLDWQLSKDRQMIRVRDVLSPLRSVRTFVFRDGRFQLAAGEPVLSQRHDVAGSVAQERERR